MKFNHGNKRESAPVINVGWKHLTLNQAAKPQKTHLKQIQRKVPSRYHLWRLDVSEGRSRGKICNLAWERRLQFGNLDTFGFSFNFSGCFVKLGAIGTRVFQYLEPLKTRVLFFPTIWRSNAFSAQNLLGKLRTYESAFFWHRREWILNNL